MRFSGVARRAITESNFCCKRCVIPPPDLDELTPARLRELVALVLTKMAEPDHKNGEQREEIARLKGLKGGPDITPSGMDQGTEPAKPTATGKHRRRGAVRPRVRVADRIIKAPVPAGSRFKGYETDTVQDLVLTVTWC